MQAYPPARPDSLLILPVPNGLPAHQRTVVTETLPEEGDITIFSASLPNLAPVGNDGAVSYGHARGFIVPANTPPAEMTAKTRLTRFIHGVWSPTKKDGVRTEKDEDRRLCRAVAREVNMTKEVTELVLVGRAQDFAVSCLPIAEMQLADAVAALRDLNTTHQLIPHVQALENGEQLLVQVHDFQESLTSWRLKTDEQCANARVYRLQARKEVAELSY
uniref:Uncharacterized protein n=1 Tax=Mycena chlorophos TaxID=658473 RepID=A0ABQ0LPI1_MYCCL|nr:predicted protein [Mycena chlorophos]